MNEEEILILLRNPQTRRRGFDTMVRLYSEPLYWKIRHIVLTHEDADDILQNTFLKVWANIDSFENRSKLSTWIYRIAINESLDFLRRKRNETRLYSTDMEHVSERLTADEWFDGDLTQARLQEAITKLPNAQRLIFTLRYFNEMKYKDIAEALNRSEGAVKASYHIAVQKIISFFKQFD
ncbi:MAG: sigma-70 family RNA polymerase sigma factor [Prevotella sp.]|nr:sigma-70 family RNA polymerase sigma factor [Prevotella sp.]